MHRDGTTNPGEWCRGISFDKLGQHEAAIADFSAAVQLDPGNLAAFFNRGTAYDALGRHEAATADFTRALGGDFTPGAQVAGGRDVPHTAFS